MAVEHALRVAGGARGVAENRPGVLVELRPVGERRRVGDQRFIAQRADRARLGALRIGQHDEGMDALQLRAQAFDQGQEVAIEQQHAAAGVVERIDDLLVGQPRIGGVQHGADAGHGEEQLEVTVGVPGQGGNHVARPHAKTVQHRGGLAGASGQARVVIAPQGFVDQPRDDFPVAVGHGGVGEDGAEHQRGLLHRSSKHRRRPYYCCLGCGPDARGRRRADRPPVRVQIEVVVPPCLQRGRA